MIKIQDDLAELNIPVYAEGDAPQDLPHEYFTFSEDYTSDNLNADNEPKEVLYEFTLKWYTDNAQNLYNGLQTAINLLKTKGYIITGVGYGNSTYQNNWLSRMVDANKIEYLEV